MEMVMNTVDFFSDLDTAPVISAVAAKAERPKFPCQSCAGTGVYRGARVHQTATECFSCGGRGFFYKSHADRMATKQKRATTMANNLETKKGAFREQNPGVEELMNSFASWSDLARSFATQFAERGTLSEKQVAVIINMDAKIAANRAAKAVEAKKNEAAVDMSVIHNMFDSAIQSGHKRPKYRAEGLVLSLASGSSVNAGAIYVKRDEAYLGKIVNNVFKPVSGSTAEDKTALEVISANPLEAAVRYGRLTGSCACCGRELTNKVSIERGIGPICADGWGF
jgi:hypothetical protein